MPLLRWKFENVHRSNKPPEEAGRRSRRRAANAAEASREMWQPAFADAGDGEVAPETFNHVTGCRREAAYVLSSSS